MAAPSLSGSSPSLHVRSLDVPGCDRARRSGLSRSAPRETSPPAPPAQRRAGASGASGARVGARLPPLQADPPFEDRSAGSTPILRIAVSHFASSASPKTSSESEGQVSQPLA